MHTTCLPSREQAQGRKLTDRLEPRTLEEETLEKIKTSHLGFRKRPAFGRGRDGGGGQVGEWPPQPQAPNLARLFSPGCSPPGPDSSLTRLGPNLPSALRRAPPPQPRRSGFPARPRPPLGAGGGGVAFPGGAVGHVTRSWTLGQRADRQAPDAISGGAPLSAQFPFFHRPSETGLGGRV